METSGSIRQVPLLAREEVIQLFEPTEGLVDSIPEHGEVLVLTSERLIGFTQREGKRETNVAPLGAVDCVSLTEAKRHAKPLYEGAALVIGGLLVYLILGTFSTGTIPAAVLGGAIAFLGILIGSRYFALDQKGQITFQLGVAELVFPYNNEKAGGQIYDMLHRCFQIMNEEWAAETLGCESPIRKADQLVDSEYGVWTKDVIGSGSDAIVPETKLDPHRDLNRADDP